VLWRAGLRISEALALSESDLDRVRGAIQVRHGKGGRRREIGMDRWAWEQLDPWLNLRAGLPIGRLLCVLRGPTRGRPCSAAGVGSSCATPRSQPGCVAGWRYINSGMHTRSRCRAGASRWWSSSGSSNMPTLGITSVYLRGVDNTEVVHAVPKRPAPMIPVANGLRVTH
jgi:hypothetical protein